MSADRLSLLLVSDFTVEGLAGLLRNDPSPPRVEVTLAPYGQVLPTLLQSASTDARWDAVLVWTRPEQVLGSWKFGGAPPTANADQALADVDAFAQALVQFAAQTRLLLVAAWVSPWWQRGFDALSFGGVAGASQVLMQANLRLCQALAAQRNAVLLNTAAWIEAAGADASNPRLWYHGKIPFGPVVFKEAVRDVKALLRRREGGAIKLVILDLDDTLWGGTLGEEGWQKLVLGGHDAHGEAFRDFQQYLAGLAEGGVLLALASKNEESSAWEAIDRHPEMVLRREHFVTWRINWQDKATNVGQMLAELNLGPQSVLFIDNDPIQRDRIRTAFPEMQVPDWPTDPTLYLGTLARLRCFDRWPRTAEDRSRLQKYSIKRAAESAKLSFATVDEWVASLKTRVTVLKLAPQNQVRALQLLNKTNQMNLTTRRLAEPELLAWVAGPDRGLWTLQVEDKFGDAGLTGLFSLELKGATAWLTDFVLSCRVMGRRIEETMVYLAAAHADARGATRLCARCLRTERNGPCFAFWKSQGGFEYDPANEVFSHDLATPLPPVQSIELQGDLV